jgi:ABC-type polysaccharide/polyol phosphate export permease
MSSNKIARDSLKSISVWRVWTFLGVQDVKARFRRSFLGPLWLMMSTVIFVAGAGLVYGSLFGVDHREFLPHFATGVVIWGFIVSSVTEAGSTFVVAEGYIKQFPYPKQIYLLRSLVGYLVVLLVGMVVIVLMQLILGTFTLQAWLWMLPGLALLALVGAGHITVFAYLGARFRDVPHALGGVMQVLFFVTPVLFPAKMLASRGLQHVYEFNPLYYLIEVVRHPLLTADPASSVAYGWVAGYGAVVWLIAAVVAARMDEKLVFSL